LIDTRSLLRAGPVVVCFYRGGWCPYCNLELRAYQRTLPRGLGFPVLSDPGNDADYTRRAEPDDVLCVVRELTRGEHVEPRGAR
jgi:hypothetical protein